MRDPGDVGAGEKIRFTSSILPKCALRTKSLDRLRHDLLMKVAVGRSPQSGAPLASQSTISRLENAPRKTEAARLTAALVDQAAAL